MDKEAFQFNFFKPSTVTRSDLDARTDTTDSINVHASTFEWNVPVELVEDLKASGIESEPADPSVDLLKRKYSNILKDLNGSLSSITQDSDVIPNKYEGGLKTWECSIDLLQFLNESQEQELGSKVLEIGCGSGLPGIFCYKKYLESFKSDEHGLFVFQDFNQNVLETVTLPNILLNAPEVNLEHFKFIYGDWNGLIEKLPEKFFDLILTSETIYRTESYEILLKIFSHSLRNEARVLLAAKDYYFGLGGSVNQFINVARSKGWEVQVLKHFSEGVPRSILELKRSK